MSARTDRQTGARLNKQWGVGAAHALYIHDGHWYHPLKRFPGALFDENGYVVFQTEADFRNCPYLSIGKDVSVPKPGISAMPGYVRVIQPSRPDTTLPEEIPSDTSFAEGTAVQIRVNRYERDERARKACIRHYGPQCFVCGFDFGRVYGRVLAGFIHVHHLTPLSTVAGNYRVNPVRDLMPVCANCHAVVHRREPPYSMEEVKALLQSANVIDA
jgi:hypothetical protein